MRSESRKQKAESRRQSAEGELRTPRSALRALHSARSGLTLAELLVSMMILGLMTVVLAGMSNAVQSAWSYTKGLEETDLQAQAAIERVRFMVTQVGVYKVTGQPSRLGLAVVSRSVGDQQVPDALVVWSGGRSGGMSASGVQSRLPILGELLIYTANPSTPSELVEIAFPGQTTAFDFSASDLSSQVATLLAAKTGEVIPLCDALRVATVSGSSTSVFMPPMTMPPMTGPSSPYGPSIPTEPSAPTTESSTSGGDVGCVRFALTLTPNDADLAAAAPQTTAWTQLNWPQGTFGNRSGLRQANLSIELQVEPDGIVRSSDTVSAIPFFGSASTRYVYEP